MMTTASVSCHGRHAALCLLACAFMGTAYSQAPSPEAATPVATAHATSADAAWSQGQVLRWNTRTRKVTLKHGPIPSLDMPPMTMVFRVDDAVTDTSAIQPGATVRFMAAQIKGAYVVTQLAAPTPP